MDQKCHNNCKMLLSQVSVMTVYEQVIWCTETFQGYLPFCAGTLPFLSWLLCIRTDFFYTAEINASWLPVETLHLMLTTGHTEKWAKIAGANS